jgi:signal transduction histidine kinase
MDGAPSAQDTALSSLRHDLRQYVAAGLALSQVADAGERADDAPVQLATIHTLFDQIGLLVDAIGETCPPRTEVRLQKIVEDCVKIARATVDIEIKARVAPTATAFGDPVLVRRALTNLLDNAAHAVDENGTIDVIVSDSGDECVIEVTDDGLGFGLAPHGSGQGLAVVTRAVCACHGRLELVSGPAQGTTIRMALPSSRVGS